MADPILTQANREAVLAALAAGSLAGSKMILIANNIPLTKDTVLADVVQPTFTGYAPSTAMTWSGAYTGADGRLVIAGSDKTFICTGGTPDEQIYGAGLTDAMGMVLESVLPFATPVPINKPGKGLNVDYVVPYGA